MISAHDVANKFETRSEPSHSIAYMMRRDDEATKGYATPALQNESPQQALMLAIANGSDNVAVIFIPRSTAKVFYRYLAQIFESSVLCRSDPSAHRPQKTLYNPTTYIRMQNTPIGLPSSAMFTPTQSGQLMVQISQLSHTRVE